MGLIHLDAGVIIGFLDGDDAHHLAARSALSDALRDGDQLAMTASGFAECLMGPARRGDDAVRKVRDLFDRLPIAVVSIDPAIATTAARLRAAHSSLRFPDALVIATAIEAEADALITTDRRWPPAKALGLGGKVRQIS